MRKIKDIITALKGGEKNLKEEEAKLVASQIKKQLDAGDFARVSLKTGQPIR